MLSDIMADHLVYYLFMIYEFLLWAYIAFDTILFVCN